VDQASRIARSTREGDTGRDGGAVEAGDTALDDSVVRRMLLGHRRLVKDFLQVVAARHPQRQAAEQRQRMARC